MLKVNFDQRYRLTAYHCFARVCLVFCIACLDFCWCIFTTTIWWIKVVYYIVSSRIVSVCVWVQVGGRLEWLSAGLTVNTTNSTLYEQFIEDLRPRTGYAVRLGLVYRSLLRSVWPSSTQHTFFTSGTLHISHRLFISKSISQLNSWQTVVQMMGLDMTFWRARLWNVGRMSKVTGVLLSSPDVSDTGPASLIRWLWLWIRWTHKHWDSGALLMHVFLPSAAAKEQERKTTEVIWQ